MFIIEVLKDDLVEVFQLLLFLFQLSDLWQEILVMDL